MFDLLDGSGREPRKEQLDVLKWLADNWDKADGFCILAPTAAGKSLIARAIQIQYDADFVTINNQLVKQYTNEYTKGDYEQYAPATMLIGRNNYLDINIYDQARLASWRGGKRSLAFNPISFCKYKYDSDHMDRNVIILDEADQHIGLLLEYASTKIKVTKEEAEAYTPNGTGFIKLLNELIAKCEKDISKVKDVDTKKKNKKIKLADNLTKLTVCRDMILNDMPNFGIEVVEEITEKKHEYFFKAVPVHLSKAIAIKLFGNAKVVLLSGTLFKPDVDDLLRGTKKLMFYEVASPIPVKNRRIYYKPCEVVQNEGYDKEAVASYVSDLLEEVPLRPAILHTTYKDAQGLSLHLKDVMIHTKHDKTAKLNALEETEGSLLAAGMTTGVDLKGAKCRLNIILKVRFPNLGSNFVKKKTAQDISNTWYDLQALREVIQSAGRSTRTPEDFSVIIISDSRIPRLIVKYWDVIPTYFKEAITFYNTEIITGGITYENS